MAKFRRTRRAASAARGGYRKFRGSKLGRGFRFDKVLAGGATNVGMRVGAKWLGPTWGPAAGAMAAGVVMNDETAQFMAGMALGGAVPLPGAVGNAQPSGGYL